MEEIELEEAEWRGVARGLSAGLADADEAVDSTGAVLRRVGCMVAGSAVAVVAAIVR